MFATGTVNSTFWSVTVIDIGQPPKPLAPFPIKTRGPSPAPFGFTRKHITGCAREHLTALKSLLHPKAQLNAVRTRRRHCSCNWLDTLRWWFVFLFFLEKCLIIFGAGIWICMIFAYGTHIYTCYTCIYICYLESNLLVKLSPTTLEPIQESSRNPTFLDVTLTISGWVVVLTQLAKNDFFVFFCFVFFCFGWVCLFVRLYRTQ